MRSEEIAAWRLANLRLVGTPERDPVAVVRWLGAVQSQDYGPAKWSVAARTKGATDEVLDRAFNEGKILRTHVLRPTWHFVLPADIRLLLQVTGPRIQRGSRPRWRELGLDDGLLERSYDVFIDALRGGNHHTRRELGVILEGAGINVDGQRLAHIMMNAELEMLLCSGPLSGKQHTYALLGERAAKASSLSDDAALGALVGRYFTSHGPATAKDLQAWCGLPLTDIKRGLAMVSGVQSMEVEDKVFWFVGDPPEATDATGAHLLQLYDEYLMGYRDTRGVIDLAGPGRFPTIRPGFNGIVVLGTQVAGEWKPVRGKDGVTVRVRPTRKLRTSERDDLDATAARYGDFLQARVTVQVESAG